MASTHTHGALPRKVLFDGLRTRVSHWLFSQGDRSVARRVAGGAFLIRVAGAAVTYLSQVFLARWTGSYEFGIYVYVATWILLLGGMVDLGLASGAQRFIPKYLNEKAFALLRGYLSASRWIASGVALGLSLVGLLCVHLAHGFIDDYTIVPLYLGCLAVPIFGLLNTQDGISRSFNWVHLALLPHYVVRQLLLIGLVVVAHAAGVKIDAMTIVALACAAMWLSAFGQMIALNRKLRDAVPPGPKTYEVKSWIKTSAPMKLIEAFYILTMYTDVLVLSQFRSPEEIAIYYAALKTLSLVAFVNFSVGAAASHKFTEYHVAGDRERLAAFLADSIRWTFWPSLAATLVILALGMPLLLLFGPRFAEGYHLMGILAVGALARASVGPAERLLNMVGEQKICTLVIAATFAINLVFCLILIPLYGATGAAIATSSAFTIETILLFIATKRRIGLHIFVWRRRMSG